MKRRGLRQGAAVIAKGRQRVDRILEAARNIIVLDGYNNFTMRKVAAKAGISLGNLQHYFSDKSALLRELLTYLDRGYDQDYAVLESAAGSDRDLRFTKLIDYLLQDSCRPIVRGLFLQFWALSSNDQYISECMEARYGHYRSVVAAAIKDLNPTLDTAEIRLRSMLVQSLVEGSSFALRNRHGVLIPPPGLHQRIQQQALRIAKAA